MHYIRLFLALFSLCLAVACSSRPFCPRYAINFASSCGGGAQARIVFDSESTVASVTSVDQEGLITDTHSEKVRTEPPIAKDQLAEVNMQLTVGDKWRCLFQGVDFYRSTETECVAITDAAKQQMETCMARAIIDEVLVGSYPGSEIPIEVESHPGGRDIDDLFNDPNALRVPISR